MKRLIISSLAVVGLGVPGAASEGATTQLKVEATYPVPSFVSGGLTITGTEAADDVSVSLDPAAEEFQVDDPAGLTAGAPCVQASVTTARCPVLAPYALATLGGGDDHFSGLDALGQTQAVVLGEAGDDVIALANPGGSQLSGGSGNDEVAGGPGEDRLKGGHGDDRVSGRDGDDYVIGGEGVDRMSGGAGDDRLFAMDHHRDTSISCGGSKRDVAEVDLSLDPRSRGCPRVND